MDAFQFKCMSFGLTGATSSFKRLMNQLFCELPLILSLYVYIDNLLIHSANNEQRAQCLRQVFDLLSEANLTI